MHITAPMKKEMSITMPIELTPNFAISFTYSLKNILNLSGRWNVRPISMRYLPNEVKDLCINIIFFFKSGTKLLKVADNTKKNPNYFVISDFYTTFAAIFI